MSIQIDSKKKKITILWNPVRTSIQGRINLMVKQLLSIFNDSRYQCSHPIRKQNKKTTIQLQLFIKKTQKKMVVFSCDGCGETLKKSQVDAHAYKCRSCDSVSCVDCNVSFWGGMCHAMSYHVISCCVVSCRVVSCQSIYPTIQNQMMNVLYANSLFCFVLF